MQFKKYIYLIVVLFISINVFAQSGMKSESELKETAESMFEVGKFIEAEPMFAQLLALYPKDPDYNFKYGVCVLASDSDKEKPLKFLKFATSSATVDARAYYYLGKTYHLNYEFGKAVKQYSKFKAKGSSSDKEKFAIDRQIEMCKNGRNLLSKINEVQVLDKQEISAKDFFRIYDLKGIDGSIITKPEDFKSKYDKKNGEKSIIYLPKNANEVYYSSYGNKGENGKDIYKSIKLGNGNWSEPVNLSEVINTPYDEDFAFIHPDGRTLYFASKGHSSMGGYDLFMSTFDNTINEWTTPVNLDFAFSSADDDVLFITDEDKNFAFFASNRTSPDGKYTVYKVKVEKEAADVAVIQGAFIAENNPSLKKAKITVIDKATNKTIGVYETDKDGKYLVEIAENGGTYQFNIETTDDAPIHTGVVTVPRQDEFEVLGQELRLVGEGDNQQLVIKNIFDGTALTEKTNSGPQISTALLRKKASLEVNLSADQVLALETSANNTVIDAGNTSENELSGNSNLAVNAKEQSLSTEENSASKTGIASNEENLEATGLNTTAGKDINKVELVTRLDQLYDQLNKNKAAVEQVANFTFQKAIAFKKEADAEFEKLETQKSSNAPEEVIEKTEQSAKEVALKAALAAQLANKIERNNVSFSERENQFNISKSLIETDELKLANNQIGTFESESLTEIDSQELLNQEQTSIEENIQLSKQKTISLNSKIENFTAEQETINNQILEIENKIASGSDNAEELESQLAGYKLDKSDMDYQIETVKKQLAQEEENANSLTINLEQIASLSSEFETIQNGSEITVNQSEKDELLAAVKAFQENNQIAYNTSNNTFETNESVGGNENLNKTASNQEVSGSSISENDASAVTNTGGAALNNASPVTNLSIPEIDAYYENKIRENQLLSDSKRATDEKVKTYEAWNNDLEIKLGEKENSLNTISEDNERAEVQGEIDGLLLRINSNDEAVQLIETNYAANQLNPEANAASSNQAANTKTENRTANISGGSKPSTLAAAPTVSIENIDVSKVDENSIIPETYTSLDIDQEYNYGNQEARSLIAVAKQSFAEAATYGKKAEDTRASAYNLSTIDARNAAFEKAGEYERASKEKQIKTAEKFALVNSSEYNKNKALIGNSDNYGEDFQSSNLDIANLLSDEAGLYYNNAQEIRAAIPENERISKKEASLQKAYDFEMLALAKQDEALKILKVVESEYEANPTSNLFSLNELVEEPIAVEESIQIDDEEVMQVSDVDFAMFKADSLTALVSSLGVQKNQIKEQIDNTRNEEERIGLEAQVDDINSLQERAKKKAELFYLRVEQLERVDESEQLIKEKAMSSVLNPTAVANLNTVSLDTVEITDERRELVSNSQAYVGYIENANKRERAVRSAGVAYDNAINLSIEKERLLKRATLLKSQAAKETDEIEKERLIKSASVIDQRVARLNSSVDSVNNVIKIKNFLITSSDRAMQNSIAGLSELEKTEIQKIALPNISSVPLPSENLANLPADNNTITSAGNQTSTETSQGIEKQTSLNSEDNEIVVELAGNTDFIDPNASNERSIVPETNPISTSNETREQATLDNESGGDVVSEVEPLVTQEVIAEIPTEPSQEIKPTTENSSTDNTAKEVNTPGTKPSTSSSIPTTNAGVPVLSNLPRTIKQAIFVTLLPSQSGYSAEKPIPVDPVMPEGIIYKVQVGAFRNPIPQDLFKGFAPLMAEKIPSGITRYTAGIFINEKEAIVARNGIRKIGYPDAFVVAFLNGKRIGITQARKTDNSAAGIKDVAEDVSSSSASNPSSSNVSKSPTGTKAALPSSFNASNISKVVNVETIEGVYYTVQVGVFSKPLISGEYDAYQPLNVKVLPNGLIRYNSGIFKDAVEANDLKERIALKISDAFVTAYYNGRRISLAEAARISNRNE